MHHRKRLAAAAAGFLLVAGAGAAAPAAASPQNTDTHRQAATTQPVTTLPQVVNARLGRHPSFDRIVIDVNGSLPSATVHRVPRLYYDGSGENVPLAGKYFLEIRITPADAHNAAGDSVYKGPRLVRPGFPKLKGFALTGDFEGVVTFGAAFDSKPVYSTARLHSPERFVVDIRR